MAYKRRLGTMSLQVRVADGDAQQASPGTLNLLGPPVPVTNEPKIVYLTRHGEAEHNPTADWNLRDPALTEEGRRQAKALRNDEMLKRVLQPGAHGLNLVVVSPLKRCLETARLLLESMHSIRAPIIAHSDIQETSESPCDTGHPPISLSVEFPEIDFDQVPANWFDKGVKGNDLASIRLQRFQNWLAARPEKNILIIAHLNSLKQLTGDSLSLRNCAVARYTFSHRGWIDVNNASGGVGMGTSSRVPLTSSTMSSVGTGGTKRLFTSPGSNGIMSASRQSNASSSAHVPPSSHHSGGRPPLPSAQSSSSSIGWDKDAVRGETSGSNLDASSRDREAEAKNRMSPAELAAALFHGVLSDVDAATGHVHTKLKRSELSDGLRRTWGLEPDIVEQIVAQSNAEARSRGGVPGDITEIDMARGLCGSDMSVVRSIASKRVAAKQGLLGSSMTRKLSDSRLLDSELNATKRPRSDARYLPTSSRSAQHSATPSRGEVWDLPSSSSSSSTPAIRPKSAVPTFGNGSGEGLGAVELGAKSSSSSPRSKASREPSWLRSATGHQSASPLRASHASSKSTRSSGAPGGHLEGEELVQGGVGNDTSMKDAYASSMDEGEGVYRDPHANDGRSGQGQGGGGGVSFGGPSPWDVAEAYGSVGMGGMKRKASELDVVKTENKALARRVEALETELRDRDASSFHAATLISSLEAEVNRLSGLLDSAKRGCKVMYERGKVARAAAQEEFERLRLEAQAAKEELLAVGLSSSTFAQAASSAPAQSTGKSAYSGSNAGLQRKANTLAQMKMEEMQIERRGAPPAGASAAANEAAVAIGASTLSGGGSIASSSVGGGVRGNLAAKASNGSSSNNNNNNNNNRVSGHQEQEQQQGLGAADLLQALDFPNVYGWKDYVSGVMEGGAANVAAHGGGDANGSRGSSSDKNNHSRTAVKYKKPEGGRGGMRAFGKASGKATWETMAGLDPSQTVGKGGGDVAMEW